MELIKALESTDVGLQKFTDFDKIKSLDDFLAAFSELRAIDPGKAGKLIQFIQKKVNNSMTKSPLIPGETDRYLDRLEAMLDLCNEREAHRDRVKRDRWYLNDRCIKACIHASITEKGTVPSNGHISEQTGLSRVTVNKHLKENAASNYRAEELEKFKLLNSNALISLYQIGMKNDNVKALKLFIEFTGGNIVNSSVVNNNYVQINNTRIDELIIEQLPNKIRSQIEKLILKNTQKGESKQIIG